MACGALKNAEGLSDMAGTGEYEVKAAFPLAVQKSSGRFR